MMTKEKKKNQTKRTFDAFKERPKTMLEVAAETGIMRASICRYVATFKKRNKIIEVKKDKCPLSKHRATFYSTDPAYFKPETQQTLFQTEKHLV